MPFRIKCPSGHTLIVPSDRAGRTLRCPRCEEPVIVPALTAAAGNTAVKVPEKSPPMAVPAVVPPPIAPPPVIEPVPPPVVHAKREVAPPPIVSPPKPPPLPPQPLPPRAPSPPISQPKPLAEQPQVTLPPADAPEFLAEKSPAERESAAFAEVAVPDEPAPALLPRSSGESRWKLPGAIAESLRPDASPRVASAAVAPRGEQSPQPPAEPGEAPAPAKSPALPGIVHDRAKVLNVYQLAAAVIAMALFSIAPAAWDIVDYWRVPESQFVARWALVLLFLGAVQVAYAVYVIQLPDWGTVWVVTLVSLGLATLYAMVLGLTLISSESSPIVRFLQLEDKIAGSKAALWCLCMTSVAVLLAFFAGRLSVRWHRTEQLLRSVRY